MQAENEQRFSLFLMEQEMKTINKGQDFLLHQRPETAINRGIEFVSDRITYIVLIGHWCDIFVVNAQAPTRDKGDDSKHGFNEDMEQVFSHLPK
jgi:hypothetical protein